MSYISKNIGPPVLCPARYSERPHMPEGRPLCRVLQSPLCDSDGGVGEVFLSAVGMSHKGNNPWKIWLKINKVPVDWYWGRGECNTRITVQEAQRDHQQQRNCTVHTLGNSHPLRNSKQIVKYVCYIISEECFIIEIENLKLLTVGEVESSLMTIQNCWWDGRVQDWIGAIFSVNSKESGSPLDVKGRMAKFEQSTDWCAGMVVY